jgi:HD-GYP domain-containing protein (c-di-GMP phosphodiesterase class II)
MAQRRIDQGKAAVGRAAGRPASLGDPLGMFVRGMRIFPSQAGDSTLVDELRAELFEAARELNVKFQGERDRLDQLERRLRDVEESYLATLRALAFVAQQAEPHAKAHLMRSHEYAVAIARRVAPEAAEGSALRYGAILHDVGIVGVPPRILSKPGPLTGEEWELMRRHPVLGGEILRAAEHLAPAASIVELHHERWDGEGYPHGLRGSQIPVEARIFAVADAFDAMTTDRPYRSARSPSEAVIEIERVSGSQFDPEIAREFASMYADGEVELIGAAR